MKPRPPVMAALPIMALAAALGAGCKQATSSATGMKSLSVSVLDSIDGSSLPGCTVSATARDGR